MEIELPPGSGRGPLIHRVVLRGYGVQSAALYPLRSIPVGRVRDPCRKGHPSHSPRRPQGRRRKSPGLQGPENRRPGRPADPEMVPPKGRALGGKRTQPGSKQISDPERVRPAQNGERHRDRPVPGGKDSRQKDVRENGRRRGHNSGIRTQGRQRTTRTADHAPRKLGTGLVSSQLELNVTCPQPQIKAQTKANTVLLAYALETVRPRNLNIRSFETPFQRERQA